MSVLFHVKNDDGAVLACFRAALLRAQPSEELIVWPSTTKKQTIDYAVVWGPPPDFFDGLTNLKAIFSVGAGVDHLLNHPRLPTDVPVVRLLDAGMGEKMSEYVLYGVLQAHRNMHWYRHLQQQRIWSDELTSGDAGGVNIGILGLGTLGQRVAQRLQLNGYAVRGWSRSEKTIDSLITCHGPDGLNNLIASIDILVCLLPLTEQTRGILNLRLFERAKPGLFVINVARGGHLNNEDLITVLDSGQLSGALLDVTDPEPLPTEHPLWLHPLVSITPHISAPTQINASVAQIIDNLQKHKRGESILGIVDRSVGY